jgi:uncharacterized protein (DUF1778 family)
MPNLKARVKTAYVAVRLTPADKHAFLIAAAHAHITLSEWMTAAAYEKAAREKIEEPREDQSLEG